MIERATDTQARLARIEAALIQANGLLSCLQLECCIPAHWQSQVKEKREMLQTATIDVIALNQE